MPNSTLSRSTIRSTTWHKARAQTVPWVFLVAMLWLLARALSFADAASVPNENSRFGSDAGVAAAGSHDPFTLVWTSEEAVWTFEVAWGDYDRDGDLDLATCDQDTVHLYRNDNGVLTASAVWTSVYIGAPRSLAWGDVDNDGDLDLVVGTSAWSNFLFENALGSLNPSPVWNSSGSTAIESLAWGDVNGDGYLDLAVGNSDAPNCIYLNMNGTLSTTASWSAPLTETTTSVTWGDMDGDGDLDLAIANAASPNRVYRNNTSPGGTPQLALAWSAPITENTTSVAWGDMNNDGQLDLIIGNVTQPSHVYFNTGTTLTSTAGWSSSTGDWTVSIALGDYDSDGDLDLVVGNDGVQPNRLYLNDGETLSMTAVWSSDEKDSTQGVAWGDVDGDGDLDLAVGNTGHNGQPNRLYRNNGGTLSPTAAWSSNERTGSSVAWGDMDNDGDLDLAVGYILKPSNVYRNSGLVGGVPQLTLAWTSTITTDIVSRLAWADYDGDSDLDLAAAGEGQAVRLYVNNNGTLSTTPAWSSQDTYNTTTIAWGDYDGDGDLDLAAGGSTAFINEPVRLYRNDAGALTAAAVWISGFQDRITSVAWGDVDNDGDLDLAVGTFNYNWLFRNEAGALLVSPIWHSAEWSQTAQVAWGDYDGDGDLDLVAGSVYQLSRLYRNDGGQLTTQAVWASNEIGGVFGVAWGDVDADADLDLAMSAHGSNRLYRNDRGALTLNAIWSSSEWQGASALAWGDVDRDGDLDLVATQTYENPPHRVYLNNRDRQSLPGAIPLVSVKHPGPPADFYSVAEIQSGIVPVSYTLSSLHGERVAFVRAWYSLNGGGHWLPAIAASGTVTTNLNTSSTGQSYTYLWDVAGSGFFGQSDNVVFRIQAVPAIVTGTLNAAPGPYLYGAYASQTFPFRVRGTQVRVVSGTQPISNAIGYRLPAGQTGSGSLLADAAGVPFHTDGQGYLQGRGEIKLGDHLLALAPVHSNLHAAGVLILDGSDDYVEVSHPTVPITNATYTLAAWVKPDTMGTRGIVGWGNYGATNQVNALRLTNSGLINYWWNNDLSVTTGPLTDTWHHVAATFNGLTRTLYLDGVAVAHDTPLGHNVPDSRNFRIGSMGNAEYFDGGIDDVLIYDRALSDAEIQAIMARTPAGAMPGLLGSWSFDTPTDQLVVDQSGHGNVGVLVGATANGHSFGGYTVYHTNGTPTETGLSTHIVTQTGVQLLTVSAAHPLILFDLDVSLEWDAHKQTAYLQQLENDLAKASAYLYDFTNGQVALGQLRVHQNADEWLSSQVVVYATNRLRPLAVQGGIVTEPIADPQRSNIIYAPGQVRMGAVWNRYGEPGGDISDWPLALAHELSHYLLYQEDVYLGLSDAGLLIPMNTCTGSVMGDMYNPDNTEFIDDQQHWAMNCVNTLANRTLGRTEWTTNRLWYPWLITPTLMNTGPSRMPFDLTRVTIAAPLSPTDALDDPTFYLDYQAGESSSSEARAYIFRSSDQGDYVVDLGSPLGGQNRIYARGAQPGDRLCVLDAARRQYGCEIIELGDERLGLKADTTWRPVVQLTPVNSQTIAIEVSGLSEALALHARLYPENGFGGEAITLASAGVTYSGTFHLAFPAMLGHVQIWIDEPATEDNPRREAMVTYSLGGNPGNWLALRGGWPALRGGWPALRGGWPALRGGWSASRSSSAPLASPGGQMLFFTADPTSIPEGHLYTMGGMTGLPPLPTGKTAIGQGYSLIASPNVTQLITGSISFQYLSMDVLAEQADEEQLTIHYWDGQTWQALETIRSPYFNMVSAPSHGPGVYALLVGVTIPQIEAIDPVQAVNNVTTTLTISGHDFLPPVDALLIGSTTTHTLPLVSVSPISITAIITPDLPAHEYRVQVINRYDASFYDASSSGSLPFALYDPAAACFYDFFESGSSKWQRSGTWNIITLPKGNQALTDSPGNSYGVTVSPTLSATTSSTSAAFSLNGCSHPILTFRHDYVIDNRPPSQDGGRVEISTDNGVTWRELARYAGGLRTSLSKVLVDSEWADVQWKDVEIDLSAYTGTVRLRFTLEVDRVGADRGWVLDQVMVRAQPHGTQVFLPAILR